MRWTRMPIPMRSPALAGAPYTAVLVDRHGTNSDRFARIAQMARSAQRIGLDPPALASDERKMRALPVPGLRAKPCASDLLAACAAMSRIMRGQASSAPSLRSRARVLLAEDHPVNAEIVCALLGECGW